VTHLSHTEEENGADEEVWGREEEGEEVGGGRRGLWSDLYYNLGHKV